MIIYDSFWDRPFEYETPPLPKEKAGISDYYRAQKNYNDLAYDDAAVRETLMNRIASRDLAMRERGITPLGDINTDEGLQLIDEQIEKINSESFKEEQLPRNSDLWESILKDYGRYAGELYDVREPSSFSRIIGTGAANLESYYKTANAWKLFSSLAQVAVPSVLIGTKIGAPVSSMARNIGINFALNEFASVPGNKQGARVTLGLEFDRNYEDIRDNASLNLFSIALLSDFGVRSVRPSGYDIPEPKGYSESADAVVDAASIFTETQGTDRKQDKSSYPLRPRNPEERSYDYAASLQKYYEPQIDRGFEKEASKAISRSSSPGRKSWNSREKKAYILENFYKDRADGAIEYFKGLADAGRNLGTDIPGRERRSLEGFRDLIESGNDTSKRVGDFTSGFGKEGELLTWAFDSKAPLNPVVLEFLGKYKNGKYVSFGAVGKEAAAKYKALTAEYDSISSRIANERELRQGEISKFETNSDRIKEKIAKIRSDILDLKTQRDKAAEIAKERARENYDSSSGMSRSESEKLAVDEATQSFNERLEGLENSLFEENSKSPGRKNIDEIDSKIQELNLKRKEIRNNIKEMESFSEQYGSGYVRDAPGAKSELRDDFAIFVNKIEVENTVKSIIENSSSPGELNKNVIDYLDSVDFLTREKLKEIKIITGPVLESIYSKHPYGIKNEETVKNFHKELKGEDTGDWVAVKLKNAFRAVDAKFADDFAKYGVTYKKLENYDPNNWDKNAVSLADKSEFVRDMLEHMDHSQTRERAGLSPGTEMKAFAENAYESLVASVRTSMSSEKGLSISKKVKAKRIIMWKNGESRYYMMSKYGRTVDPFELIRNFAFSSANNLAKLEILGDKPSLGLEFLKKNALDRFSGYPGKSMTGANRLSKNIDEMYALMFDAIQFVKDPPASLKAVKTVFNIGRAFKLHGSVLTSLFLDPVTIAMYSSTSTRNPFRNLFTYLEEVAFPSMTREEGRYLGVLAEETLRYSEEMFSSALDFYGAKYIETFEKFNFTDKMTSINKFAVNNIMIKELGDHSSKKWEDLPSVLREDFEAVGITPREWEEVRHMTRDFKGFKVLNPRLAADSAVNSAQHRAARKLQTYLSMIENLSVPSYRTSGDLGVLGNPTRGYRTAAAEGKAIKYAAYRSMAMFTNITNASAKSFTDYILKEGKSPFHIFAMIAVTAFMTLLLGWSKEIEKGKKPTNPFAGDKNAYKFIFNSFIRAGFMNSNQEYIYSALYPLFTGGRPEGKVQSDAFEALGKISHYVIKYGKADSDASRRAVANDLLYYVNPFGSSPFSELYSRVVTDNMIKVFDPEAHDYFREKNKRVLDEGGVYYWAPGGEPFKELAKE